MTEIGELKILIEHNQKELKRQGEQHDDLKKIVMAIHEEVIKYKAFINGIMWILGLGGLVVGFIITKYFVIKQIVKGWWGG